MAVTRISRAEDPTSHETGLSDYEKLRLGKIKRNEARLKELGLFQTKDALAASVKKKKAKTKNSAQISPELPQRRSSRKRKTIVDYSNELVIPMYEDDEEKMEEEEDSDSNDEESESNNDGDEEDDFAISDDDENEEEELEEERPKKRSRQSKPSKVPSSNETNGSDSQSKKTVIDTSFDCINPKGGLTLEYAKTGRSSCRKCRNKIDKGKPRVGMEAWIVGRNCVTWQRPQCLLKNLCCLYEKSNGGKGKCKASHAPFAKGQLKVGIRCHTATSYYHTKMIAGVLANIVSLMRSEEGYAENFELTVDDIDGNEKLSEEDREKLETILKTVFQQKDNPQKGTVVPEEICSEELVAKQETKVEQKSKRGVRKPSPKQRDQPKAGAKTGAKGKVEWKFGGRSCYGTLIPRMESKTHCYARTHKGNVKTLAKGKDYWSMRD
jgi:hypothetical protein